MKRFFLLFLCLLLFLCTSGCGNAAYQSGMSFTYILPRNLSTLDPQTASGDAAEQVISALFEGLCRIDREGEPAPGAASKWEENRDSTVFTFTLRNGLVWSDGRELTAADFLFGIRRALRTETACPGVNALFPIKNAKAVYRGEASEDDLGVFVEDERTITFQLEESCPDFPLLTASLPYLPCNEAYFTECAGHYGLSSGYLITNGPFAFESAYSWQTDQGKRAVNLVRSETYRGEAQAKPSSLSLLIDYKDSIDADPIGALKNGDTDAIQLSRRMAQAAEEDGCTVLAQDDAVTGLLLNPRAESLSSVFMRQLFVETLDRQRLLDLRPNAEEAQGIMAPCVHWNGETYYQPGETAYALQNDELISGIPALLSQLELEKVPSITVICPDDEDSIAVTTGFLACWNEKLGNAFNMEPLSDGDFQYRIASGDYQAALYTLRSGGTIPYQTLKAFESIASPTLMEDPSFDEILHGGSFSLSSFREMEASLRDAFVFYPLFYDKTYFAVNPSVRDLALIPGKGIDFIRARKKK